MTRRREKQYTEGPIEQDPKYLRWERELEPGFATYKRKPWTGVSAPFVHRFEMRFLMSKLVYWRRMVHHLDFCASELFRILEHVRDGRALSETDKKFALFLWESSLVALKEFDESADTIHRMTTQLCGGKGSSTSRTPSS
jgi:hypothetical protein